MKDWSHTQNIWKLISARNNMRNTGNCLVLIKYANLSCLFFSNPSAKELFFNIIQEVLIYRSVVPKVCRIPKTVNIFLCMWYLWTKPVIILTYKIKMCFSLLIYMLPTISTWRNTNSKPTFYVDSAGKNYN